ncbi:MAG: MFS transporter, partial [Clostridia bacterium]|nr:MFS transporter [Clostridia bacterium]
GQFHQQFLAYVEGLDTEQAGRISLISGLWDAFNDPVMGIITDRTKSRFGRRRPWILAAAVPFGIAYIFRWTSFGISASGNLNHVWLWYLMASLLYGTFYTMAAIPHAALLPAIAPHYFERTQYKIVEYAFNSVGQVSSWVFMALALSGFNVRVALTDLPTPSPADRSNYMMCGLILAAWFTWPLLYCFFKTKEPENYNASTEKVSPKYLYHQFRAVFASRAFRQFFLMTLFFSLARSFYSITDQYFMISVADKYKYFISLNIVAGIAEFSGSPLNYLLVRYKGKTFCGKLLGPLMTVGLALNGLITPTTSSKVATAIIFLSAVCYNFGFSGPGFVSENIQPDVIDVDELMTGENREGVVATFRSLFSKTISSLISYVVGASIKAFGYDVNVTAPADQSARTILGLRLNFVFIPTILAALCTLIIFRFTMTKQDHEMIKAMIAEKRETGTVTATDEQKERVEKITGKKWETMWIGQS